LSYQVASPFWQWIDHWQTLITGVLALVAGIGTIWATIASAQREIAANQAQTKVAQDQLATTLRLERRRILRDGHAFLAMVEAAMGSIIADVTEARVIAHNPSAARRCMRKAAFPELRNAFLHYGGDLIAKFLELEKEIDEFAGAFLEVEANNGSVMRVGLAQGLLEGLEKIELLAVDLRGEASEQMRKAAAALAETQDE
jgi:hypothetical protein